MLGMKTDADQLWEELIFQALASDGPIRDRDVKDAVKIHRPKIEAALAHEHSMYQCDECDDMYMRGYEAGYDTGSIDD